MGICYGDLNGEKIAGTFYEKKYKNQIKKSLEFKKVINRKYDKLQIKWKSYNNSFNRWTDKKSI